MLKAEVVHPRELSDADVARWRALADAHPAFESPLLGPDFAHAVGDVRADARVAILRRGALSVGFLAFHARPGGLARPIAAPMSDYHALVSDPAERFTGAQALSAAGLAGYPFTGLIDPYGLFERDVVTLLEAHRVRLQGPAENYLEAVRALSPKKIKNYRRLCHKLERDLGPLRIVAPDDSGEAYEALIAWKRAQLRRTGVNDFLRPDWTRALLAALYARREGAFRGLMVCLYAGERMIAGHFGVRLGVNYHPWIASHDPGLGCYSPGQAFMLQAIAAMDELGLTAYDLGPGHDHYKRGYALDRVEIAEGFAAAATPAGAAMRRWEGAWTAIGARGGGATTRLRRRLDAIAATELTFADRARGLAVAIADQTKRHPAPLEVD